VEADIDGEDYIHSIETPVGTVREIRRWSEPSYSWPISHKMIQGPEDLKRGCPFYS